VPAVPEDAPARPGSDYLDEEDSAATEMRRERQARSAAATATVQPAPKAAAKGAADALEQQVKARPADAMVSRPLRQLPPQAEPAVVPEAAATAASNLPAGETAPGPVLLAPVLPALPGAAPAKVPSPLAVQFMQWLQAGLASNAIRHNDVASLVHFVPQGMAIVSPLAFKAFVREGHVPGDPERAVLTVQREVLKAGWHVPAGPGGKNIHRFVVRARSGVTAGRLAAVVLDQPHRWVLPVPPPNPAIQPLADAVAEELAAGAAAAGE